MYYYYYPSVMVLGVSIGYVLFRTRLSRILWLPFATIASCSILFVLLIPISSSAGGVTSSQYDRLMVFPSWRISSRWMQPHDFTHIVIEPAEAERWLGK